MARITSSYTPQPDGEVVVRENLAKYTSFDTTAGWAASRSDITVDTGVRRHSDGPASLKAVVNVNEPGVYVIQGTGSAMTDIPVGEPFTVLASVLADEGAGGNYHLLVYEYDASGNLLTPILSGPDVAVTPGIWADLSYTFTPKPTAESVRVGVMTPLNTIGQTFWFCEPLVTPGVYSGGFFNENTPASGDIFYRERPGGGAQEVLTLYDSVTTTEPRLVLGYQSRREARTIVHRVLDRTDPDVSLREAGLRTGVLDLFYLTEQDAYDAELMHSMPAKFQFVEDGRPTASMTYVVTEGDIERRLDDETRNRWVVSIPYAEVAP